LEARSNKSLKLSTSLNISGTQVINDLKFIPEEIALQVDYIIDD